MPIPEYSNIIIAVSTGLATIISLCKILGKKFDKIDQRFEKIDQRFEKIDQRFEKIEERLRKIEEEILWIKFQLGYNPNKQHEVHIEEPKEN
jgi:DNA anti-recombination protein RmuC